MRGTIRPVADLDTMAVGAWTDLATRVAQPNPLFEPDCLVPASRHLPEGAAILMVSAEEAGQWFGCFPVKAEATWRAIRRPVFRTHVRRMMYDGVPLLDRDAGPDAAAAMLRSLQAVDVPGITVFEWLDDGPVADVLGRSAHALGMPYRAYNRWERPIALRVPDGEDPLAARHSRKWLRNQERMLRRLGEELGTPVELRDRSDDRTAVDLLLGMEAAGHKGRNGVAVLTKPGEAAWFRAMCDGFRASGRLHVYALCAGSWTVALYLLVQAGEGLFAIKATYDESLSRFSPGIQLHLAVIRHVTTATDIGWIDTCTYQGNTTLLRLYPDRRRVSSTVVAHGGIADRLVLRAVTRARTVLGRDERLGEPANGAPASGVVSHGGHEANVRQGSTARERK
jgi:CelD/BcsL family acetyltransferase involved in cellulose biosynthesis